MASMSINDRRLIKPVMLIRFGSAKFLLKGVLDKWFRRRFRLKIFLIWSPKGPFVPGSRTICAILVEGIMS